jgi:hypothetical protein
MASMRTAKGRGVRPHAGLEHRGREAKFGLCHSLRFPSGEAKFSNLGQTQEWTTPETGLTECSLPAQTQTGCCGTGQE